MVDKQKREEMQAKQKRVRLIDVAERAKVSRWAVSSVLLGTGKDRVRVSDEKAAFIKRLADEMGFFPDNSAQMLKGKKSKIIGVLIDSYPPQAYFEVLASAEAVLCKNGYRIMVGQTHDNYKNLKLYISDFVSRRVDGIICFAHGYPDFDTVKDLKNFDHVVFVGEPRNPDVNHVATDIKLGVRKIVKHLLETGCKRIGHFLLNSGSTAHIHRLEGYREELENNNFVYDEKMIFQCSTKKLNEKDYMDAINYLVLQQGVDAIIANNDMWGVMLIKYLQKSGIKVPEDVAVVGFDNLDIVNVSSPELTSIDIKSGEQGKAAARMILEMIEGKSSDGGKQIKVDPEIVVRRSTQIDIN